MLNSKRKNRSLISHQEVINLYKKGLSTIEISKLAKLKALSEIYGEKKGLLVV